VEVARGRAGYGFTLSGQAPCVLSCVMRGGPADLVGLRAGDQILAVNEIAVKKASHEDVVKLIGKCSGVLHMVVAEGAGHLEPCSSDEEGKGWLKPKLDSKALGINRAERVVAEMQSGGILSMILESPALCPGPPEPSMAKQRPLSEPAAAHADPSPSPSALSHEEVAKVLREELAEAGLDASILNVAMVVGYLGSIELPSTSSNLEQDSLQAIRGCLRRLRAEQRIHSLVSMEILQDGVRLCSDRAGVLAEYPAEKLAFSALCPDDRRFFGLVTMQAGDGDGDDAGALRTSCHVFMVDPDLSSHRVHQGIARRFGLACTADPDTGGCLEFPASSLRWFPAHVLQGWQCGHASDQESYTDSTDGWSSVNCGTLPPPMSKIPADRYRVEGSLPPKSEWPRKALGVAHIFGPHRHGRKTRDDAKGLKPGCGSGLAHTSQRTPARRACARAKRFSITRSLDDLEPLLSTTPTSQRVSTLLTRPPVPHTEQMAEVLAATSLCVHLRLTVDSQLTGGEVASGLFGRHLFGS
ncbi:regulator of G-protein signaling 12-like, partial [Echinops telfairi]|uniref:Regulator of G-protein signaling 12-like n=1 Tax=Echinops telfairi TaxID=9371 RepID=A0AC55D0X8_ECHTE